MSIQLALNLRLRDGSSFENFQAGANREALAQVRAFASPAQITDPRVLYLWGERATGKTHLLEAACRSAQGRGTSTFYVSLAERALAPAVLEEVEDSFLICLDDVHYVAGSETWESALFVLYERLQAGGGRLIVTASAVPAQLGLRMPDVATRLGAGPVYQLHGLDDTDKLEAVRLRGRNRGLDISLDAAHYILRRYPRDLHSLFALLDRIDAAALASQRRVTVPFLRALETRRES